MSASNFNSSTIKDRELYKNIDLNYNTTLGEVVDYINEFKLNIDNKYIINDNEFKFKLYETYKDYYKKIKGK